MDGSANIAAALQDGLDVPGHWSSKEQAMAATSTPVHYDLPTDSWVTIDQAWLDQWMDAWNKLMVENIDRRPPPQPSRDIPTEVRLKVYANPMRDDCVFVAEDKPIEPYRLVTGANGEPLYPATPDTPLSLRAGVEPSFGHEIVRRWNSFATKQAMAGDGS